MLLVARGLQVFRLQTKFLHSSSATMGKKIAMILSGCGVYDGTEVHEASACLVHLSREGAEVSMFAPNIDQMHVIDHTKGEEMKEKRNVLVESARIARGKIAALDQLKVESFDGLVVPGGFGAAKNLSNFAVANADAVVNSEVEKTLKSFHSSGKPIGLCCIAPTLAARVIPGCEVTMGGESEENGRWPYAGATGAVGDMGSKHVARDVTEVHVDAANKIVTTPAFMCETKLHEIHEGIGSMIKDVLRLA